MKMVEQELEGESDNENESDKDEIDDINKAKILEPELAIDSPYAIKSESVKPNIEESKDQGFTRPKILILTGYKKMAFSIVNEIILQFNYGSWKKVIKRKRFNQEFDLADEEESVNDCFKLGISFLKNNQVKLYENLIDSDIIIASPLGLRLITGQDGEQENRREYDFLSSVQIVILDQAETFLYQNLEHLEEVLKSSNRVPKTLDILNDITRIQDIYLEKLGKNFRQSIVIQNFRSTDMNYIAKQF